MNCWMKQHFEYCFRNCRAYGVSDQEKLLIFNVVREFLVDMFVSLQGLLVVATAAVATCHHQLPPHLTGPAMQPYVHLSVKATTVVIDNSRLPTLMHWVKHWRN